MGHQQESFFRLHQHFPQSKIILEKVVRKLAFLFDLVMLAEEDDLQIFPATQLGNPLSWKYHVSSKYTRNYLRVTFYKNQASPDVSQARRRREHWPCLQALKCCFPLLLLRSSDREKDVKCPRQNSYTTLPSQGKANFTHTVFLFSFRPVNVRMGSSGGTVNLPSLLINVLNVGMRAVSDRTYKAFATVCVFHRSYS